MRIAIIIALMLFCVGCDKGNYIDVGPVIIDKALVPESEVKNENRRQNFNR
jgi:hypothetical protein